MLLLHTLGAAELRIQEGSVTRGVALTARHLALLASLALRRGAVLRRDVLLPIFWPESDTERARASLRSALSTLRRALGEEAIETRGKEELRLAPARVWCDAAEFEARLEAGDPAGALALYRGDFLAGLHLSGAPEWERWVDAERERLRGLATGAAWTLAARAEEQGDPSGAAGWARRAAGFHPDEEEPLRRLLEVLDRIGDRAAALTAYEGFAQRLRREYDVEPSRRTRVVAEAIRFKQENEPSTDAVPAAADAASAPTAVREENAPPLAVAARQENATSDSPPAAAHVAAGTGEPSAPLPGRRAEATAPRVRRRLISRWLVLASLLVAAGVAVVWQAMKRTPPALANDAPIRIAVLPFTVRGPASLAYLGAGMAELLSARLDGAGRLRTVSMRALLAAPEVAAAATDEDAARQVSQRFGASWYVLGSIIAAGPQVQLRAALYDGAAAEPVAEASVDGPPARLSEMTDTLAVRLLAGRLREPGQQLGRTAASSTTSFPALKAYLRGEDFLRAGKSDSAVAAFQEAVTRDSSFALAWYRLSTTIAAHGPRLGEAARNAVRFAGRLTPHNQLLLRAALASWDFRYAEAERLLRTAVAEQPDDVEAWAQLADVLMHGGPPRGRPAPESRPVWERVLVLEPTNLDALDALIRFAATERRLADLDTLTRRALALSPAGERAARWLAFRGLLLDDEIAMARAAALLPALSDVQLWITASKLLDEAEAPARMRPLLDALTDPVRPPRLRASGYVLIAHASLARGQWRGARDALAGAEQLDSAVARQARALFTSLPFLPVPRAEANRMERVLLASRAVADAPPGPTASDDNPSFAELRLYQLGLLAGRRGDSAAALAYARQLDGFDPPSRGMRMRGPRLADGLRAQLAWTNGRPARGLAVIDSAWQEFDRKPEVFPYVLDPGHPRFLRAELLRLAGRDAEALAWYDSVLENYDKSIVYAAPVHLRTAEILDRFGRRAEAAAHYRRFLALWRDADPPLQPLLLRARARLAQIE